LEKKSVIVIVCDHFKREIQNGIVEAIKVEYGCSVLIKDYEIDMSGFYFPARRQYDANKLLKTISEIYTQDSPKKIALFKVDLFIPILTYIFGQAILNGDTGIASLYRLRNEHYGLEKNNSIRNERLRKVIIHEIGHMYGLIHCHNPTCVMLSSTYVEDIDQKSIHLCFKCRNMIGLI
jgi:archaemetzincin